MESILALFIPIGMCVIMPIMIVWLVLRNRNHQIDKKTEVLLKAIENGQEIDPELFTSPQDKKNASTKKMLLDRLQSGTMMAIMGLVLLLSGVFNYTFMESSIQVIGGGLILAIGIGFLVAYTVGKRMLSEEIKAEEEKAIKGE